ncbi:hypothetical protein [Actinopolyspora xinjiangensis]|nr:hypothetical protein [Actinopolyspora xinjiangensis]
MGALLSRMRLCRGGRSALRRGGLCALLATGPPVLRWLPPRRLLRCL